MRPTVVGMDTPIRSRDRLDLVAVVRLLVLIQGAVLVSAAIESMLFLTVIGPSARIGWPCPWSRPC